MTFYSYDSLSDHVDFSNYLRFGLFIVVALAALVVIILYRRHRTETKYRGLFILLILSALLLLGIQYNDFQTLISTTNQQTQVRTFVRSIAKFKHTKPNKVFINAQSLNNATLVNIGSNFYIIEFNSDHTSYQLSPANLVDHDAINYER